MANGNLGNLWYELDIKDNSQSHLQNIIKGIESQLSAAGKKGVTIGGIKIDPKAGQELVTKLRNILQNSGGLKIDKLDIGKALRLQIDIKNIQEQLDRHTFRGHLALDVNPAELQAAVNRALRSVPQVQTSQLVNIGGSAANINSTTDAVRNLNKQMNETSSISKKVQTALAQAFSVHAVKNFLSEVVNIGGELEKQRLAMGNILGDMYEANELTKKISNLSMISPFTVQELTKATRLLTAYGVEYNEVYDITKRLSDIAAGVGVGFERIAYAFGHITSMGNLDARTLRMFQNMGVPLLQKLSEYYQTTQGKSFSTAEVRKMITDRQVSSEDVISVMKRMTDAGGQFYQMQEVMAESLATKWANLANAWNLMLGSMAEDPAIGGNLKSLAEVLTAMTQNWKNVKAAMTPVAAYILTVKANSLMAAHAVSTETVANQKSILAMKAKRAEYLQSKVAGWELVAANRELVATVDHLTVADYKRALKTGMITKEMLLQVIASKQLSVQDSILIGKMIGMNSITTRLAYNFGALGMAARTFATTLKGLAMNPMTWVFAATEVFMQMRQNSENEAEKIKENIDSLKQKSAEGAKNIKEALKSTEIPDSSRATLGDYKQKISDIKDELKEYDPLYQKTFRDVDAVDGQGKAVHTLQEQYEILRKRLLGVKDAYEDIYDMSSVPTDLNSKTGDGWFDKTYTETAESYQKALDGVNSYVNKLMADKDKLEDTYKSVFSNIEVAMSKTGGESLKKWQAMKKELDGMTNTADKLRHILTSEGKGGFNSNATGIMGTDFQIIEKLFSASQGLKIRTQELGESLRNYLESEGLTYGSAGWEMKAKMIMDSIMDLTSLPENAKLAIEKGFFTTTGIINWVDEGDIPAKDPYSGGNSFQNRQYDAIDVLVKKGEGVLTEAEKESRKNAATTIKDIVKNGEDSVDTIEKMQSHIETLRKDIKQLEKADDAESLKQKERLEYELQYAEAAAKAAKYSTEKPKNTTGGSGADKVKQGFQEEIDLAKEAYAEYKKWYDLLNNEAAATAKVGENPLFQDVDGKAIFGDPKDIRGNYEAILTKIGNSYPDLQRKLRSLLFDFDYDEAKDNAAKALSAITEEIDRESKKWNLYDKLYKSSGDKTWSYNVAFDGNDKVWDEQANALREKLSNAISEKGLISADDMRYDIEFIDWDMNEEQAKAFFGENGELVKLYKAIKDRIEHNAIEVKTVIAEARKSNIERTTEGKLRLLKEEYADVMAKLWNSGAAIGEIKEVMDYFEHRINELGLTQLKEENGLFHNLFSDNTKKSISTLYRDIKDVSAIIKYINTGKGKLPPYLDKTQIEGLAKDYELIIPVLTQSMNEIEGFWDKFGGTGIGGFIGGLGKAADYAKKSAEFNELASKATGKQKQDLLDAAHAAESKAWSNFASSMANASDSVVNIASKFKEIGKSTNNKHLEESAKELERVFNVVSSTANGAATGGWIGAAVGFVTSLADSLVDMWAEAEINAYKAKRAVIEFNREMIKMDLTVDENKYKSIFGEDTFNKGKDAWDKYLKSYLRYAKVLGGATRDEFLKQYYSFSELAGDHRAIHWGDEHSTWANEIFGEDGRLDIDRAKAALSSFSEQMTDSEKDWLNDAIAAGEKWEEAKGIIDDIVSEWFGTWGEDMTDVVFDSIMKGADAWEQFEKIGAESILNLGKTMMNSLVFQSYFKQFEGEMEHAWGADNTAETLLEISSRVFEGLPKVLEQATDWGKQWIETAKEYGFNLTKLTEATTSTMTSGIKGITETQADLLASYINGIRADVSVTRSIIESMDLPSLNAVASSQLAQLNMIAANTAAIMESNASLDENVRDLRESFNSVMNGTRKLYIQ